MAYDVAIVAIGTRGDFEPCLGLAVKLQAQGMSVAIVGSAEHGARARSFGVDHYDLDFSPASAFVGRLPSLMVRAGRSVLLESIGFIAGFRSLQLVVARSVRGSLPECRLVLFTMPGASAIHVAEQRNLPSALLLTQPLLGRPPAPSAAFPRNFVLGACVSLFMVLSISMLYDYPFRRRFNTWRQTELNLRRDRSLRTWMIRYRRIGAILDLYPGAVVAGGDAASNGRETYGFIHPPASTDDVPTGLSDFLQHAAKVCLITRGSMPATKRHHIGSVVQTAIECGYKVVVLGNDASLPLSSSVFVVKEFVDIRTFSDDIDCAIHHGGAGTFATFAELAIPQIVLPIMFDQFYWGYVVKRHGVGTVLTRGWRSSRRSLRRAMSTIADASTRVACRNLAEALDSSGSNDEALRSHLSLITRQASR